ncbi:glycoside hydrolase family protein [Bacteroidota bacterium]
MNYFLNKPHYFKLLIIAATFCYSAVSFGQYSMKTEPVDAELTYVGDSRMLDGQSILEIPGYFVWGGSVVKGRYGKYHMFFSRWIAGSEHPKFSDGWLINSEICYAVSNYPDRNFRFVKVILKGRRHEGEPNAWDAQGVHNPHIQKFGNMYYLYYIGSNDPGEQPHGSRGENVDFRNRIQQNQKIGVVTFRHIEDLLNGDYTRSATPILSPRTRVKKDNVVNPSPRRVKAKPDNMIVVNPSVVFDPNKKKYLLYFKGNLYDPYWRGVHGLAIGDSPVGPFLALDNFVFDIKMEDGRIASAEDPYVWYNKKDDLFYAVMKDFSGQITQQEPGLAILVSRDGIDWDIPDNPFFMKKELTLTDGRRIKVDNLERPQLLIDENGYPLSIYLACSIDNVGPKTDGSTFNVQIKLME